ncbi:hypothetical protein BT96DRAFT_749153, partial [Gymnopus androsaceus JB14]
NKSLNLRKFELSDMQWDIVDDLLYVLEIFKNATMLFSKDTVSTISQVIPMMDIIDDFFGSTPKRDVHPAVRSALELAQSTLNRYYSRTDDSNVYQIAMILHPKLKLEYFRNCGWEKEWIDTA